MKNILIIIGLTVASMPAHAYIGPGMGAGVIASVLGILGAILLAIVGVLYYPIKRMLKKRKVGQDKSAEKGE